MRRIRMGIFETNSSSTHAICIAKDVPENLPETIYFKHGYFGWEHDVLSTIEERASYLYEVICGLTENDKKQRNKDLKYIVDTLWKDKIRCEFEEDKYDEFGFEEGGIDHVESAADFYHAILRSEKRLKRFLFGNSSIIVTGNDNSDDFGEYMGHLDKKNFEVIYEKYN